MNKKIMYITALVAAVQFGKAQTTEFYPNDIFDALHAYDGDFNASGTARYIGMGESMGALGADISAVETNPAGLGVFRNSVANFTLGITSNENKASMPGTLSNSNTETKFYPNAGVALALGDESDIFRVNFGVNYLYQSLDNGVVFPRNNNKKYLYPDVNGVDQEYVLEGVEQYMDGYKSKLKFSIATNYDDKFYFGLGLDWHYLDMNRSSIYSHRNTVDGELMNFQEQLTPYSQEANGFGLSVGVIGKITPEFRLGAAYHSPIWWSNIDYSYYVYGFDDNDNVYGDLAYYDKYKNTAPGKLVLSAAFASNIVDEDNSLAVNFDFINRFNKDYDFKGDIDYRTNNYFVSNYMQDSQEYRVGVEYRYKELKLRAGYGYTSSPVKDRSVAGQLGDISNTYVKNYMAGEKNKFSVGAGYDIGPFFIDLAYQYLKSDYYTSYSGDYFNPYSNTAIEVADNANPVFGKVQNTQNNFALTLGFRF